MFDDSDQPLRTPDLLPGQSSVRLIVRGNVIMLAGGFLVIPLAFESSFGRAENLYMAVLLSLIGLAVGVGCSMILAGSRKRQREQERGYTAKTDVYAKHPELFLVDYRTLEVISRPRNAP